ncbi:MAG: LytTR family DNA-binding domain-containing protein [Polyangiaceae bacterium]
MPSDSPFTSARPPGALRLLDGDDEAPASVRQPVLPAERAISVPRIAARRKRALVFLDAKDVWAFEADARLTFVHSANGRLDIDVSLAEIEAGPLGHLFVRVHRSWLANLSLVKALEHAPGETQLFVGAKLEREGDSGRSAARGAPGGIRVPVSRDRVRSVRDALLSSAIGVRRREGADEGWLRS